MNGRLLVETRMGRRCSFVHRRVNVSTSYSRRISFFLILFFFLWKWKFSLFFWERKIFYLIYLKMKGMKSKRLINACFSLQYNVIRLQSSRIQNIHSTINFIFWLQTFEKSTRAEGNKWIFLARGSVEKIFLLSCILYILTCRVNLAGEDWQTNRGTGGRERERERRKRQGASVSLRRSRGAP